MKIGMYRMNHPALGECARVKWTAGDGAPHLPRGLYQLIGCEPPFEMLPSQSEYAASHRQLQDSAPSDA